MKHLADLLRNRANSQRYSSIYEDWTPKIVEDTEKSDSETIKPGAVKRPELDPNRGHPNNQDSETNFTLLLQRTCKVGVEFTHVHFPLHMCKTPSQSSEEQSEQPAVPQHI